MDVGLLTALSDVVALWPLKLGKPTSSVHLRVDVGICLNWNGQQIQTAFGKLWLSALHPRIATGSRVDMNWLFGLIAPMGSLRKNFVQSMRRIAMADDVSAELNPLLAIVLQAGPEIATLQAAQANIASYQDTIATYQQKLEEAQTTITETMASLKNLSDQFVAAYQAQPSAPDTSGTTT
jgi:hypothetical protein